MALIYKSFVIIIHKVTVALIYSDFWTGFFSSACYAPHETSTPVLSTTEIEVIFKMLSSILVLCPMVCKIREIGIRCIIDLMLGDEREKQALSVDP